MSGIGRHARTLLKFVVSFGLLAFLLRNISLQELGELLRTIDRRLLAGAVLVFLVSNVLGAIQWFTLLKTSGIDVGFVRAFRYYFVGLFFNNFLPANIGGDAVKVYDVSRVGASVSQVVAATLVDRIIGIFALCLLAVVAWSILSVVHPVNTMWAYLLLFLVCMIPLAGFYFVTPMGKWLRKIVARIQAFSFHQTAGSVLDHMGLFKSRRMVVARLVLFSLVIQSLRVTTHVLVAGSIGIELSTERVVMFFVFVPVLALAMIPPVTINGLGVREGLGILLFSEAGILQTDAFAVEFLTYIISVVVSLTGFGFFLSRRRPDAATSDR